jgi:hypothetical protein
MTDVAKFYCTALRTDKYHVMSSHDMQNALKLTVEISEMY